MSRKRRADWLPHPAKIVGDHSCPTGQRRFPTSSLPLSGLGTRPYAMTRCPLCKGFHPASTE